MCQTTMPLIPRSSLHPEPDSLELLIGLEPRGADNGAQIQRKRTLVPEPDPWCRVRRQWGWGYGVRGGTTTGLDPMSQATVTWRVVTMVCRDHVQRVTTMKEEREKKKPTRPNP